MKWPYKWLRHQDWTVIIHHSATKDKGTLDWSGIYNYHVNTRNWVDIGYHFGIEKVNGEYQILTGRPLGVQGAHCKRHGMNSRSIGICFVGNYERTTVPDEMYDVGIKLIAGLCQTTLCNSQMIFPHKEFTNTLCPGNRMDIGRIRAGVWQIL